MNIKIFSGKRDTIGHVSEHFSTLKVNVVICKMRSRMDMFNVLKAKYIVYSSNLQVICKCHCTFLVIMANKLVLEGCGFSFQLAVELEKAYSS